MEFVEIYENIDTSVATQLVLSTKDSLAKAMSTCMNCGNPMSGSRCDTCGG